MRTATKSPEAFRTISEVAEELDVPQHVLRFWETKFSQIKPLKRAGGRRYYRPDDVNLLMGIRTLLYTDGFTIKGVQKVLREQGVRYVMETGRMLGQEDRPLPVSHSGQVSASEEPEYIGETADDDGESVEVTVLHRTAVDKPVEPEKGSVTPRQRAALESILEELLELKFTLDGARATLAKSTSQRATAAPEPVQIRRLA